MPIEISWFDSEKTILFGNFLGAWTWEDYAQGLLNTIKLAEGIEYRLDQIIDFSKSGAIPAGHALTHFNRNREYARALQIHLTVFVGASPILRGLVSALEMTNIQRTPRLFADSIEDAYELIKADRNKAKNEASSD
jgi:hypothetical protein